MPEHPREKFEDFLRKPGEESYGRTLIAGDTFTLKLSLDGDEKGFLAIDANGYAVISKAASPLIAYRIPASDKMYIKVAETDMTDKTDKTDKTEKWLTHWDISKDLLGAADFCDAVAWKIKKIGSSSQMISDFSNQSLSIKDDKKTGLFIRDDYSVLDVKIIR